jgi:hypothetical protein
MKAFDAPELEFAYKDEEITDPQVKAKVVTKPLITLAGKKPIITQDEAREAFGRRLPTTTRSPRRRRRPTTTRCSARSSRRSRRSRRTARALG